jgi:hypothetical protein
MRAMDLMLGLEPIDGGASRREAYHQDLQDQAPSRNTSSPSQPSSFKLSELLGIWSDAGYGPVAICPLRNSVKGRFQHCGDLYSRIENAQLLSTYEPARNQHSFLIDFHRLFGTSHIVAVHDSEDTWFGTVATLVRAMDGGPPKLVYDKVNGLTIRMKKTEKGLAMDWHGIFGKDKQVPEAEDFVEVSFTKI